MNPDLIKQMEDAVLLATRQIRERQDLMEEELKRLADLLAALNQEPKRD